VACKNASSLGSESHLLEEIKKRMPSYFGNILRKSESCLEEESITSGH